MLRPHQGRLAHNRLYVTRDSMDHTQKTIPNLSSGRSSDQLSAIHEIDRFIPHLIIHSGNKAAKRFTEFFAVTIRNGNTREAYYRACCRFLEWCADIKLADISSIEPLHVAVYIEYLGRTFSRPTVKQHLAAIRMLFDWLAVGQVLAGNPAISVRGPKHYIRRGITPTLSPAEIRQLLYSIDTSTIIGLRDRALATRGRSEARTATRPERPNSLPPSEKRAPQSDRHGYPAAQ